MEYNEFVTCSIISMIPNNFSLRLGKFSGAFAFQPKLYKEKQFILIDGQANTLKNYRGRHFSERSGKSPRRAPLNGINRKTNNMQLRDENQLGESNDQIAKREGINGSSRFNEDKAIAKSLNWLIFVVDEFLQTQ